MTHPLEKLTQVPFPIYKNSKTVLTIGGVAFRLEDIAKVLLGARLNCGLAGDPGNGKSQKLADIQGLFGNNATYVVGRNSMEIKDLYRKMNFEPLAKAIKDGGTVSIKDISSVTDELQRPIVIVEEANRCVEDVQNQLLNIFEGYVEIDGKVYALGKGELETFTDLDGTKFTRNVNYCVGMWSANFGNGELTGTSKMDQALRERSHLIIDVDEFMPKPKDLDKILYSNAGEVRLKKQDNPVDNLNLFREAFNYLKQCAISPRPEDIGAELCMFRYLVLGLDYIPCAKAMNSKRNMKDTWPSKAEEDNIGTTEEEKLLYRAVYPASIRSGQTIITFARALREYAIAKGGHPDALDSIIESFRLVAPFTGIIRNPERIREDHCGNYYTAATKAGAAIKQKANSAKDLMEAVTNYKSKGEPLPQRVLDDCKAEFECFSE